MSKIIQDLAVSQTKRDKIRVAERTKKWLNRLPALYLEKRNRGNKSQNHDDSKPSALTRLF
jgi:hypothetical protein